MAKLFIGSLLVFLFLVNVAPGAFVAFGKMIDAPRCFIGMKTYCDRNYDHIYKFGE